MINKIQLTENLSLQSLDDNFFEDEKLITVHCSFLFFGKKCEAYVGVEDLQPDRPRFSMIESCGELHRSFTDLLEEEHIWNIIYAQICLYKNWWYQQL